MSSSDPFWTTFGKALGYEMRGDAQLTGASGQQHDFAGIGVDEKNNRLLLLSQELDPRTAALIQSDVSLTLPDTRVISARPILFDVQLVAKFLIGIIGREQFSMSELGEKAQAFTPPKKRGRPKKVSDSERAERFEQLLTEIGLAPLLIPILQASAHSKLSISEQIVYFVRQASLMDWSGVTKKEGTLSLAPLIAADTQKYDREFGLCPIPLYELTEADWETFRSGTDLDFAVQRLRELELYQYFYPSPDHVSLGLIDQGIVAKDLIINGVDQLPSLGHPMSRAELIDPQGTMMDMLNALEERGYLTEGEVGLELSETGQAVRANVKFRPREGILWKLLRLFYLRIGQDGFTFGRSGDNSS